MKIIKKDVLKLKIEFYKLNGWVKIENFFSPSEIKKINNNIKSFLNIIQNKYDGRDINFISNKQRVRQINSFHKMHDSIWVKNFAKQKKIIRLIKLFLRKILS